MRALAFLYGSLLLAVVVLDDLGVLENVMSRVDAVPFGDKLIHVVLAAGLGFFAASVAPAPALAIRSARIPVATLVVALVIVLEEGSQRFLRFRTFELLDLAADALGLTLGTLLALRRNRARVAAALPTHH